MPDWKSFTFLVGDWVLDNRQQDPKTELNTFMYELSGKILVRRSKSTTAALPDKPVNHRESITIFYFNPEESRFAATLWDTEGHVIFYKVDPSIEDDSVTLISATPKGPQRVTYRKAGENTLAGKVEQASADRPSAYKVVVEWTAHRRLPGE